MLGKICTVVLSVGLCVAMMIATPASAQADSFILAYSEATLLSGGTTDCLDVNSSDCRRGLASAMRLVREQQDMGNDIFFIPYLDRSTAFVQMHPNTWGINGRIFDHFGLPIYVSPPSLFTDDSRRGLDKLYNAATRTRPLHTNVEIPATNRWRDNVLPFYVHNNVAYIYIESTNQPNSAPAAASAAVCLDYLATNSSTLRATVVLVADAFTDINTLGEEIAALTSNKPTLILATFTDQAQGTSNGTIVTLGAEGTSGSRMTLVRINLTATAGGSISGISSEEVSLTLDDSMKDTRYFEDQTYLQTEANLAEINDPVIGESAVAVPFGRNDDSSIRTCLGGECSQGNLFTDSIRWKLGVDVALTPSGGLRGSGWNAGPIKVSFLWEALPFANTMCKYNILGVKLWQILNVSTYLGEFISTKTEFGDRLLQVSGAKIVFSTNFDRGTTGTRLISVEILDTTTNLYEPLDRLKVYSVGMDSFLCATLDPFAEDYFPPRYAGESGPESSDELVQVAVQDYLNSTGSFNSAAPDNRMINDTAASTASAQSAFVQTAASCVGDTFWKPDVVTCMPCPDGEEQKSPGALSCTPIETNNTGLILGIVIPLVLLLILVLVLLVVRSEMAKAKNVRNTENAPRSGSLSLMFTDIQDSTKLWGACPASMALSLEMHHAIIREMIAKHKAYEVKTVGDSFMIAIGSGTGAIELARDIQLELQQVQFPSAITGVYAATTEDELDAVHDDPNDLAPLDSTWNGLRVRIGVHYGEPEAVFDEVAKGYDYYGPPVNVAARIESVAKGGQIACGSATNKLLDDPASLGVTVRSLGVAQLKGVAELQEIFEIMPTQLTQRKFLTFQEMGDNNMVDTDSDWEEGDSVTGTAMPTVYTYVVPFKKFLSASLKLVKEAERRKIVETLAKAWRVGKKEKEEEMNEAIVRRVIPSMRKELEEIGMTPAGGGLKGDPLNAHSGVDLLAGSANSGSKIEVQSFRHSQGGPSGVHLSSEEGSSVLLEKSGSFMGGVRGGLGSRKASRGYKLPLTNSKSTVSNGGAQPPKLLAEDSPREGKSPRGPEDKPPKLFTPRDNKKSPRADAPEEPIVATNAATPDMAVSDVLPGSTPQ